MIRERSFHAAAEAGILEPVVQAILVVLLASMFLLTIIAIQSAILRE